MAESKWRIILVSHGDLASGMLDSIEQLMGKQENIAAYGLRTGEKISVLSDTLEEEIRRYGADHILFLSDMLYGSPFNAVVSLAKKRTVYHITGMNLALALGAVIERGKPDATMDSICTKAMEASKGSIRDVKEMLANLNLEESS